MRGRNGPGNFKHPNKLLVEHLTKTHIVQRGLRFETQLAPYAVRHQRVNAGALVNFIEMRKRVACIQHATRARLANRRPVHIVQESFRKIGSCREVLESLLILDADGGTSKIVGDSQRGDVHAALIEYLIIGQLCGRISAGVKLHALVIQPTADALRLLLRHSLHLRIQRGLAESLLKQSNRVEYLVGNNGVVHPHAAFIEYAQDGAFLQDRGCHVAARLFCGRSNLQRAEWVHLTLIVADGLPLQPALKPVEEILIAKIFAPQSLIRNASLGQGTIEIQHADQAGPLPTPIGDGQDRAAMMPEAGEHVMAVLPDRFRNDDRSILGDLTKHVDAVPLAVNEAMTLRRIKRMSAPKLASKSLDGGTQCFLQRLLRRPAHAVR